MDVFTPAKRSEVMARIRDRNTKPELVVRSYLHGSGLRFRLHDRSLPGTPDLVFRRRRLALFVHGCFWHGHEGCKKATLPRTRPDFWRAKIESNRERDRRSQKELEALGWRTAIIWECEIAPASLSQLAKLVRGSHRGR